MNKKDIEKALLESLGGVLFAPRSKLSRALVIPEDRLSKLIQGLQAVSNTGEPLKPR